MAASTIPFSESDDRTATILVVEDEYLVRAVISDYLQECGFRVLHAASAAEAISIIEGSGIPIHFVFSDVSMPGVMDGFGLSQWLRSNRPAIPVLLTSGDSKKAALAMELCENQPFIAKPYELKTVVAHIRAKILAA